MEKTPLFTRVWYIAKDLNIDQTAVSRILCAYINFCKEDLKSGKRVSLSDIVYIVPNQEIFSYKSTLSYICDLIARNNGFTYNTVLTVINAFFKAIKLDIFEGKSATVRGIVTIQPLKEGGKVTRIHSSVSQSLQSEMKEIGNSVRVHTHLGLKRELRGNLLYDR